MSDANHWTTHRRDGAAWAAECSCGWEEMAATRAGAVEASKAHKTAKPDSEKPATPAEPDSGPPPGWRYQWNGKFGEAGLGSRTFHCGKCGRNRREFFFSGSLAEKWGCCHDCACSRESEYQRSPEYEASLARADDYPEPPEPPKPEFEYPTCGKCHRQHDPWLGACPEVRA